jgi:hypothetical protein
LMETVGHALMSVNFINKKNLKLLAARQLTKKL